MTVSTVRGLSAARRLPGLALLGLLGACSSVSIETTASPDFDPGRYQRIAVVDSHSRTISSGSRQAVADQLTMKLLAKGWDIVDRSNVDAAKAELRLQNSYLAAPEDRARLGKVLNVQAMAVTNLASDGQTVSITTKMFDCETNRLLWMAAGEGTIRTGLAAVGGAVAGGLVGSAVGRSSGAVAGAVGGAIVGADMAPKQLAEAKKVVDAIAKDFPAP